jgi:hypothetical protein
MKPRHIIGLALATLVCFVLSYSFAKIGGLTVGMIPYPLSVGNQYLNKRPKMETVEIKKTIPVTADTKMLRIEGVQADVTLIPVDGNQMDVDLKVGVDRSLVVGEQNGEVVLKVEGAHENHFGIFAVNSPLATLEVRVPKSIQNLSIQLVAGNIKGEGFQFKDLNIKNTSGDIKFMKTKAVNSEIHSVSGWVGLDGTFEHVKGNLISGEFRVYLDNPAPDLDLHTVSGGMKVRLPLKADTTVGANFVSGIFTIKNQGPKKLLGRGSVVFGKGTGTVQLTTTSGDISIE